MATCTLRCDTTWTTSADPPAVQEEQPRLWIVAIQILQAFSAVHAREDPWHRRRCTRLTAVAWQFGDLAIWRWKLSTKSWRIQDKLGTIFRCRRSTIPWSPKLCRWVTFLQFKHADLGTQVNTPSGAGDAQIGTGPNDQTAWAKASTVWRFWVASVATKLLETAGLQNRSHHFLVISRKPWSGLASNIYIYKYICI